jgi:hypothetical protein
MTEATAPPQTSSLPREAVSSGVKTAFVNGVPALPVWRLKTEVPGAYSEFIIPTTFNPSQKNASFKGYASFALDDDSAGIYLSHYNDADSPPEYSISEKESSETQSILSRNCKIISREMFDTPTEGSNYRSVGFLIEYVEPDGNIGIHASAALFETDQTRGAWRADYSAWCYPKAQSKYLAVLRTIGLQHASNNYTPGIEDPYQQLYMD